MLFDELLTTLLLTALQCIDITSTISIFGAFSPFLSLLMTFSLRPSNFVVFFDNNFNL